MDVVPPQWTQSKSTNRLMSGKSFLHVNSMKTFLLDSVRNSAPRRLKINSRSNYRWFYYGYSSNSSPEKKETFTHRPVELSLHHCAVNYGPTHLSDEVDRSSKEGPGFDAIRWDAAISLRTYHWMYTPEI